MAKNPAFAPRTLGEVNSKKKPVITRAIIAGDTEVAINFFEARQRMEVARIRAEGTGSEELTKRFEAAKVEVEELREQVQENALIFKFRNFPKEEFRKLVEAHPLTDAVVEQIKAEDPDQEIEGLQYNPFTFPQALVAKASYDPKMKVEEVQSEIWDNPDWNEPEKAELFEQARMAQVSRNTVGLGKD